MRLASLEKGTGVKQASAKARHSFQMTVNNGNHPRSARKQILKTFSVKKKDPFCFRSDITREQADVFFLSGTSIRKNGPPLSARLAI